MKKVTLKGYGFICETDASDFCASCPFAKGCQKYGHFLGEKLLKIMKEQGYPDHNTNSPDCWCHPEITEYKDGTKVIVHNRVE